MKFLLSLICINIFAIFTVFAQQQDYVPNPPVLYAKAWVLMDFETGAILAKSREDLQLPPASLTKIMTDYIVASEIEQGNINLTDMVRVSTNAWIKGNPSTGGSSMFLREKQMVSIADLLKGLTIQSGNDASIVLAEKIGGTEEGFATMMNQQAAILGMQNTNFVNSSGWPAKNHYSSARDMAILTASLIKNFPENYQLYREKYFTFNDVPQNNRNQLLWQDPSVDGVKTGSTDEAGHSLVASAVRNNTRYISVVMGTDSQNRRFEETKKLLAWGFRYFKTKKIFDKDEILREVRIWKGKDKILNIGVANDLKLSLPRHSSAAIDIKKITPSYIEAPIVQGEVLGKVEIYLGDKLIYEGDLISKNTVEQAGFFSRLWDSIDYFVSHLFQ